MSSEVEEIKNRLSVVELLSEYIRLQKAGSNWKALCPFHNEKTPSFMASEERRSWHCFGCGKGGDIFSFVMEMEGVGFRDALEMLATKANVELKKRERGDKSPENDKKKLYQILELSAKWYEKNLWEGKGKEKILKYLYSRGLNDESIKKFRLGYAPDGWRNMLEFLTKRGYKIEEIVRTGLLVERNQEVRSASTSNFKLQTSNYYDRFRDRITFPIHDSMGRIVGFSARVAPGGDEKMAKYINTPQTELYDKSRILYGMNFARTEIKKSDGAVLVEGNMDVIASHQAGFPNTIAVSGTALTTDQIKTIKRFTENIKMAFDMDSAGQVAAKKSARICLENDINVKIVLLPQAKDAAEIIKEDKNAWRKAVGDARGVVEYFFEDAFSRYSPRNPTEKKKIARELLNIIKDIADPVEKAHWIKDLARKLDVGEKTLLDVLAKIDRGKEPASSREKPEERKIGQFQTLAKRILGLTLTFPREASRKIGSLSPDYFSEDLEKKIFAAILEEINDLSAEKVKQKVADYEAQKYIDEAVFEVEVESRERKRFEPLEDLEEAAEALKRKKTEAQVAKISRDIREAEARGDREAVNILMREFQELSRDLKK